MALVELAPESRNLIDGELVEASNGNSFENVSPSTEEVLGSAADGTKDDMHAAVDAGEDNRIHFFCQRFYICHNLDIIFIANLFGEFIHPRIAAFHIRTAAFVGAGNSAARYIVF